MKNNFKKFLCLAVVVVMSMSLLIACGGDADEPDNNADNNTPAATEPLTEEEYLAEIETLQNAMLDMQTTLNGVDQTDADAVEQAINDIKKPFEDAIAITPPETYAEAHAKISEGCQAFVDYFDYTLELMEDPSKAADLGDKIQELMTAATTSFAEGLAMLEE